MVTKYWILALTILTTFSCRNVSNTEASFKVEYKGAIKNIMHKGDLSAKAPLTDFENVEHLYAIGAIENLKGEILIMDSRPFISSVDGEELVINESFDHKATLLVYVSVAQWQSVEIPNKVTDYEALEKFVEQAADKVGIDTNRPFPFLLEGKVASFNWHVINWKEGDMEHSHKKHKASGLHGIESDREIDILGFYSNSHHAIFTHHSTNMHLHVKTKDNALSGHLDGLTLGQAMVLKLPKP